MAITEAAIAITEPASAIDTAVQPLHRQSQDYPQLVTSVGYKLHIETVGGDIPIAAVLTSASVHDSQVAIQLIRMAS